MCVAVLDSSEICIVVYARCLPHTPQNALFAGMNAPQNVQLSFYTQQFSKHVHEHATPNVNILQFATHVYVPVAAVIGIHYAAVALLHCCREAGGSSHLAAAAAAAACTAAAWAVQASCC